MATFLAVIGALCSLAAFLLEKREADAFEQESLSRLESINDLQNQLHEGQVKSELKIFGDGTGPRVTATAFRYREPEQIHLMFNNPGEYLIRDLRVNIVDYTPLKNIDNTPSSRIHQLLKPDFFHIGDLPPGMSTVKLLDIEKGANDLVFRIEVSWYGAWRAYTLDVNRNADGEIQVHNLRIAQGDGAEK